MKLNVEIDEMLYKSARQFCDKNNIRFANFVAESIETAMLEECGKDDNEDGQDAEEWHGIPEVTERNIEPPETMAPFAKEFKHVYNICKSIGLSRREAAIKGLEAARRITGHDGAAFLNLDWIFRDGCSAEKCSFPNFKKPHMAEQNYAKNFFTALNDLAKNDKKYERYVEERGGVLHIRMKAALKAMASSHISFPIGRLYDELKMHPAFVGSNVMCRGYFGRTRSFTPRVWKFDIHELTCR